MNKRERRKKIRQFINKAMKLLSYAVIVILIFFALFFAYFFVSLDLYKMNPSANHLPRFGLYAIVSPSMYPNIKVHDVVFVMSQNNQDNIKKGDVITFISNSNVSKGLTVTHRVVDIVTNADGTKSFFTKGDNNDKADQATVSINDILGKVIFKIPKLGKIRYVLSNMFGWVMIILLPALGVIIYDFIKLFKLLSFNNKLMKFSKINRKIETDIDVEDLKKLQKGMSIVEKQYKEDKKTSNE